MAIEEEKELEAILRETDAPKRAAKKGNIVVKAAKLTGRTISSLKNKVKEKRLSRAYDKYNKTYRDMRIALVEANKLKAMQEKGENVTDSEVIVAYDEVESYNKRLSKYAVKLLTDDIKKVVSDKKARPIRVPRILLGKFKKVVKAVAKFHDNIKSKKLQRGLAKDIKKNTKEYIQDSVESALFKNSDDGTLREPLDAKVIQGLKLDRKAETFEEKIANLRKFISTDGKTSVFGDEEIGSKEKAGTDVPPVKPKADVQKEEKVVTEEDLLKGIAKTKNANSESAVKTENATEVKTENADEVKMQKSVSVDDLMKNLPSKEKEEKIVSTEIENSVPNKNEKNSGTIDVDGLMQTFSANSEEKEASESKVEHSVNQAESDRKREIASIVSLGQSIDTLGRQLDKTSDPATRAMIENYIRDLRNELSGIIDKIKVDTDTKVVTSVESAKKAENEDIQNIEPIEVTYKGKHDKPADDKVVVKKTESMRAEQISGPSTLRVTPQDIKKMEERNDNAQKQIVTLTEQRRALEEQRSMLKQYIEVAKTTRDAEFQAKAMAEGNANLANEVAALSSEATAINSDLGRSKK